MSRNLQIFNVKSASVPEHLVQLERPPCDAAEHGLPRQPEAGRGFGDTDGRLLSRHGFHIDG